MKTDMNKLAKRIAELAELYPSNISLQSFDTQYFLQMANDDKERIVRCISSGIENPGSQMGCYAGFSDEFDRFSPFFSKVLSRYHQVSQSAKHHSGWIIDAQEEPCNVLDNDLSNLGLSDISMRIRVARNLVDMPLSACLSESERVVLENRIQPAIQYLIGKSEYGGHYYSLSPQSPNFVGDDAYRKLVAEGLIFRNIQNDPYMLAAGIASDWPLGRGCYLSANRKINIWVGEEDHLRIICISRGTRLNQLLKDLKNFLGTLTVECKLEFSTSKDFGFITSCPTNLGTGMRASVHIALPGLAQRNSDKELKALARKHGLGVRGRQGEHTEIGQDGLVDISPLASYCISEAQIVKNLYNGIRALILEETSVAVMKS